MAITTINMVLFKSTPSFICVPPLVVCPGTYKNVSNASKVALVHLVEGLNAAGFVLLDTQFINPHLERMGAIEITRDDYQERLARALAIDAHFTIG